jgi:hypothetical protein
MMIKKIMNFFNIRLILKIDNNLALLLIIMSILFMLNKKKQVILRIFLIKEIKNIKYKKIK